MRATIRRLLARHVEIIAPEGYEDARGFHYGRPEGE